MKYLSVCSGIEAASVAWHHLGWTPVAFSEIEPFPAAVLKHRFPHVPNYGDMTRHAEWPLGPGSIDLLVGGTPCQSFSVAGLRKGLSDPRGGLMLTYLEIAQRLRPRWIVWENVPGVLSSGGGRDFGSFLGALVELGYGVAYRVLDAQWVRTQRHPRAVPQRRRRCFVVGCLGDWERAAAVLFERESVQRDSAPRRAQGEGSAADAEGCAATVSSKWAKGTGGPAGDECYNLTTQPIAGTLGNRGLRSHTELDGHGAYIPVAFSQNQREEVREVEVPGALAAEPGTHQQTYIAQPVPYDLFQITAPVNRQNRKPGDPCHTLARDNAAHAAVVGTDLYNGAITGDVAATMGTPGSSVNASGPTVMAFAQNQVGEIRTSNVSGTINTNSNASGRNTPMAAVAFHPTQDPISSTDGSTHCMGTGGSQGHSSIAVAVESLQQQGYDDGHASTQEADAIATLRVLRDEIGAEAFTAWGLGVLDSLQPSQVLRSRLHGEGIRCASFSRGWPIDCAISRPEDRAAWAVQSVREAEGEGCSPSRRELPQQLAEQLGAYLSQLPCPGPQAERLMHHLWCASEGVGILRQALSEIQEARRPVDASRPTSGNTMTVRRLTATECEFLQGFPRNWTLIPWRKKPADECPDGPRYKALGNSMAVNCMAWIGERIAASEAHHAGA